MKERLDKFAFLVHPLNLEHFLRTQGFLNFIWRRIPSYWMKKNLLRMQSYKFAYIEEVMSLEGMKVGGYVIMCPWLPDQFVGNSELCKNKIIAACKLAKNLGAKIIGLGGFTSIITNGGLDILNKVDIAITSGNTYTASLVIDSLLKLSSLSHLTRAKMKLAIIGASGDIGSISSRYLSQYFEKLILVGRDKDKLNLLAENIRSKRGSISIEVITDVNQAVKSADLIITATSSLTTIITPNELKAGSILCDVAYPANINRQLASKRSDIVVFEGGLAECDSFKNCSTRTVSKINQFNAGRTIHGCFAETILLTLEKRFENYSLGKGGIQFEKIDEIRKIALKHGFRPAIPSHIEITK